MLDLSKIGIKPHVPQPKPTATPFAESATAEVGAVVSVVSLDSGVTDSLDVAAASDSVVQQQPTAIVVLEPTESVEGEPAGPSPEGFKARLDAFDAMIVANAGITQVTLDMARGQVAAIMTELKQFPEYDGFVIARDVHNILVYVRASVAFTKNGFVIAAEKKSKAAAKKASNAIFDLSSLSMPSVPNAPKQIAKAAMSGLDAFASLNVDDISAQMNRTPKK